MRVQQISEQLPQWANWLVITGSAVLAWVQPIAGVIAIVWGGLQIFTWVRNEMRSRRKGS